MESRRNGPQMSSHHDDDDDDKRWSMGDGSPPAGPRGGALVWGLGEGRSPPEAETHCRFL